MITIPPVPAGSTHLEYSNKRIAIVATLDAVGDFKDLNTGQIRFGRYHQSSDRFESLMPNEEPAKLDVVAPVQIQSDEHRTMKDQVKKVIAPSIPKPPTPPKAKSTPLQKGERKVGGAIARIHAACEEYYAKFKKVPNKADIGKLLSDLNLGTINTQISAWRRGKGLPLPSK